MRTEHGGGVPQSATFAQTLATLKAEGSSILLVGRTSVAAHRAACRRLVGDEDDSPTRRRLYVHTLDNEHCGSEPGDAIAESETVLVTQGSDDGTTATPDDWAGDTQSTVVDSPLLSTLGTEIIDAIEGLTEDDDPDPGEFRLCFDSVTPLLREHKSQNVFRLLHMITSRTRQVQGMGHFHLPLDRDSDYVRLLEPLFDAVVEVRRNDESDRLEQRWHLRDRDADSGWIAL
ncbi:DUF7504 family protein [Haloarchaeobius sp. DFWS5]|uniref:DUF7504 family protein n=1 Tax=Haloarchaeobius sp. DFWS5 TaxID=3446114 RepID=UPI003EBCF513